MEIIWKETGDRTLNRMLCYILLVRMNSVWIRRNIFSKLGELER